MLRCTMGKSACAWLACSSEPSRSRTGRTFLDHGANHMRAVINVECTPAEARAFLGLPNVEPLQVAVMEELQQRMLSEIDRFSPEALMKQWLSAFPENAERVQDLFAQMFLGGTGRTGPATRR